jgi:hypothetical protein
MSKKSQILTTGILVCLIAAGCTTNPYADANWDDVERTLQVGMTPEYVKTLLGEPSRIDGEALDPAATGIVTWVYRRKTPAGTTLATTGVIEVPWFDPITGELKSEKQPLFTPVDYSLVEEFHLHWRQGGLYQWQRFEGQQQRFQ